MNRPNMYLKQLVALAAWLRAEGDEEAALEVDALAERLSTRHEAVDDQTTPNWTVGPRMDALDVEPAIRCWPEVGCVFEGDDGPVLTIDPMDGGDVSIVHMGDVVRWMSRRIDADTSERATRAAGEAQAKLDAERVAYDATVGSGYEGGHCYSSSAHRRVVVDGVQRYCRNRIINDLVDSASGIRDPGPMDLNSISARTQRGIYTEAEQMELYRLTGYSVSGFEDVFGVSTDDRLGIELAAEADREGDGWVNPYSREAGGDEAEDSEGVDDIDDADTGAEDDE